MVRATNAAASRRRKKKVFKLAKGFWGDRKNHLRLSMDATTRAMAYSYTHRKLKKRDFRNLWVSRLGVAAKMNGISYSKFIYGLKKAGCEINRKMLSELAINSPEAFTAVVTRAKAALAS